ncbi:P-loop NTPase [Donghicola sp. XS_ASV15]|uniref:P-loop NTPase n=1 Tax=Donghicola sp. XS_ASV15 TaxID=3241295 RepID=UPI003519575C
MKSVLFIHGDKGGVGKTQCATRTAAAFEAVGRPLTLVDGDVKNPGLDMLFEDRTTCVDLRTAAGILTPATSWALNRLGKRMASATPHALPKAG